MKLEATFTHFLDAIKAFNLYQNIWNQIKGLMDCFMLCGSIIAQNSIRK